MSASTPLEELAEAIEKFLRETDQLQPGAFMTGWVLGVATARVQADDDSMLPMVTGSRYPLGPETSIIQLAGLADHLKVVAEKAMWQQMSDADDD